MPTLKVADTQHLITRVEPKTLSDDTRSMEAVWTTGHRGLRQTWSGAYYEELSLEKKHIRMDRAKNGLPLLDNHGPNSWSSENVNDRLLGRAEAIKIVKREGGGREGIASLRFSDVTEVARTRYEQVKAGDLRDLSVGYKVYKYKRMEDVETDTGELIPLYRAVDWEPVEISVVSMPFDPSANIRSNEPDGMVTRDVEVIDERNLETINDPARLTVAETCDQRSNHEENTMTLGAQNKGDSVNERSEKPEVNIDAVAEQARKAERENIQAIYADCARSNVEQSVADDMVKRGLDVNDARKEILDIVAKRQVESAKPRIEVVSDEGDNLQRDLSSALAHRANAKLELLPSAQRFRHYRLLDMARACIGNPEGLSADEVCRRAFQSTSSFTNLLENTLLKVLRDQFDLNVGSFEPFVDRTTLSNFQEASITKLGDQAGFLEIPEHSEFKNANFSDTAEPIQLKTYGQVVSLTRNAIINDDLRAFNRFPLMLSRNARYLEADLVYAILVANAALSDGVALFHANHGNLGTGGAISNTTMDEAFKLFRQQTTEGSKFMNVAPRYLIVPPAIEATARRYVSDVVASQTSNVNIYAGQLEVIVDARLSAANGGSDTAWYLAASPMETDTILVANLDGAAGVQIDRQDAFDILGVKWRAYYDFAAAPADYRGLFKNAGV